jgi:hypothetical protein
MSGPYCETCKWFYRAMLGGGHEGECMDPAKRIYRRTGDVASSPPLVHQSDTCRNWASEEAPDV